MNRQIALIPAALILAGTLVSCSTDGPEAQTGCVEPGSVSDAITVEGEFGKQLTLTSEMPGEVSEVQRTVLETGQRGNTDPIDLEAPTFTSLTVFDGADGTVSEFTQTELNGGEGFAQWVSQTLNCANGGDRVVIVAPKQDVVGEEAAAPEDTIVIVSDLYVPSYTKAEGEEIALPDGFPEVTIADSGEPSITVPDGMEPPATLTVETMVKGEGDTVEVGDTVFVHYRGIIMRTGEEFDSSWSREQAASFSAAVPEEAVEVGAKLPVIRGFRDALVGQTVGSRVMSIVPAEDGGYGGEQLQTMGHQADDVMIFVLDILGAVPAPGGAN